MWHHRVWHFPTSFSKSLVAICKGRTNAECKHITTHDYYSLWDISGSMATGHPSLHLKLGQILYTGTYVQYYAEFFQSMPVDFSGLDWRLCGWTQDCVVGQVNVSIGLLMTIFSHLEEGWLLLTNITPGMYHWKEKCGQWCYHTPCFPVPVLSQFISHYSRK